MTTAAAAGLGEPGRPVLQFDAADAAGGHVVDPGLAAAATSFTLVYDLLIPAGQSGYGGLAQFGTQNGDDAELFLNGDGSFGIGISGQYDGAVAADAWVRLAFAVEDRGDGSSVLSKYIDGALAGTQVVETGRFTVGPEGFLILADNDGETFGGYLANFAFAATALDAAAVAALGGATAEAIPGRGGRETRRSRRQWPPPRPDRDGNDGLRRSPAVRDPAPAPGRAAPAPPRRAGRPECRAPPRC
ncbi:LamG-like jellyroll fold domain-containing protein [Mangrovicoccus ximenensis]|uniref:LamG-like jellyroll fold domain-containing protein n=1 Tax=Mangrovicoccus ximenensis TaxID=1911570 RepID=UPI000D3755E4|nr:LamG-like jellyroll fold domain-containing protein [Mangrovicoccus ximenensis]